MDTSRILQATQFALRAHGEQKRKYTGEHYVVHPLAVADYLLLADAASTEMMLAAILHDTVEDTPVTLPDISIVFGEEVADLVYWLSDVSAPTDGNRKARKEIDRQHIARAPPDAKTVKLADLIDNSRTILKYDPDFSVVYMQEKRRLLEVLSEGDSTLYTVAATIVSDYYARQA